MQVPRHTVPNRLNEEGLADEVVKARVPIHRPLAQQAGRGDGDTHDGLLGPALAQVAHGGQPVHDGHAHVHEDDVRTLFGDPIERLRPVVRHDHLDTDLIEETAQDLSVILDIVHHQGQDPLVMG